MPLTKKLLGVSGAVLIAATGVLTLPNAAFADISDASYAIKQTIYFAENYGAKMHTWAKPLSAKDYVNVTRVSPTATFISHFENDACNNHDIVDIVTYKQRSYNGHPVNFTVDHAGYNSCSAIFETHSLKGEWADTELTLWGTYQGPTNRLKTHYCAQPFNGSVPDYCLGPLIQHVLWVNWEPSQHKVTTQGPDCVKTQEEVDAASGVGKHYKLCPPGTPSIPGKDKEFIAPKETHTSDHIILKAATLVWSKHADRVIVSDTEHSLPGTLENPSIIQEAKADDSENANPYVKVTLSGLPEGVTFRSQADPDHKRGRAIILGKGEKAGVYPIHAIGESALSNGNKQITDDFKIVIKDATPPVIGKGDGTGPNNPWTETTVYTSKNTNLPIEIPFTDNSGHTDGGTIIGDLPKGLIATHDNGRIVITGTPDPSDISPEHPTNHDYNLKLKVCDKNVPGQDPLLNHDPNCTTKPFVIHVKDGTNPLLDFNDATALTKRNEALVNPAPGTTPNVNNNIRAITVKFNTSDNSGTSNLKLTNVPSALTYDAKNHTLKGVFPPKDAGKTFTIHAVATDPSNNHTDKDLHIQVSDGTDPTIVLHDMIAYTDKPFMDQVNGITDNTDSHPHYTLDGIPKGLSYNDQTRKITGIPDPSDVLPGPKEHVYPIIVNGGDASKNMINTKKFNITIKDATPPVFTPDPNAKPDPTCLANEAKERLAKSAATPKTTVTVKPDNGKATPAASNTSKPAAKPAPATSKPEATAPASNKPVADGKPAENVKIPSKCSAKPVKNPDGTWTLPDKTYPNNEKFEFPIPVGDNSKVIQSCTITGLPEGATYDKKTCKVSGLIPVAKDYPLTVVVTDPSGNKTTGLFTLHIIDKIPPVFHEKHEFTFPVDTPNKFDITVNDDQHKVPTVVSNWKTPNDSGYGDGSHAVSYTLDPNSKPEYNVAHFTALSHKVGTQVVELTATDPAGNKSTYLVTVHFVEKTKGNVNIPDESFPVNTDFSFRLPRPDGAVGKVTCEATGLPDGVTLDKETCTIHGAGKIVKDYPIKITYTDQGGRVFNGNFILHITPALAVTGASILGLTGFASILGLGGAGIFGAKRRRKHQKA